MGTQRTPNQQLTRLLLFLVLALLIIGLDATVLVLLAG